ncbi:uncharacterized protein PAC_15618 [Phialocephala subalpina]|uniref:Uncharacterized protein n=1 Tax=Phialocephala subalpina TaxID=576137 RepID=A0A1L7XL22_9HELO|nr:uncharacterized protein PAC_15618 [Phialocephala subalpina]
MALNGTRAQLLANLKCLYGPNVEVLTLCVDTFRDKHQALAISFEPFNATWTKFLHSELDSSSTGGAIESLLRESERELAKHFLANGYAVPFQGNTVQTLTLRRGQLRDSSAGSSLPSEFVFITTPGSTSPDDSIPEEPPTDEAPVEEAVEEEAVVVVEVAITEDPPKVEEKLSEPEPEPESVVEVVEEFGWGAFATGKKKKKGKNAFEELPKVEEPAPEPELEPESITVDFGWGTGWGATPKKDKKKKGKNVTIEEPKIEELVILEVDKEKEEAGEFGWGSFGSKKDKKKGKASKEVEETPAPEPEPEPEAPADDFGFSFGSSKKDKKKKGKGVTEEPADPEPEPEKIDEDFGWGSFGGKKNKKKKGKGVTEEPAEKLEVSITPPLADPEPELEPAEEFGWGSFATKKDKKKSKNAVEEPSKKSEDSLPAADSEPKPEPEVDDDMWAFPTKKDKEKNSILEPLLEVAGDEWSSIWQSKRSKKDKETLPKMPLVEESSTAKESSGQRPEAQLALEAIGYPTTTPSLPGATSIETTARTPQPQVARSGQTVVFTIQYPTEISNKPLQVMIALADNTRAALFNAVNSYLDSKSTLTGRQGQRKLEIKYGVGKNGDVDLSAVEEAMWPEYLEYFRQYTRLPELTVDVVDY